MKVFVGILKLIISGVLQGSIQGPILFNLFTNHPFYFIGSENLHNLADDNTLSDHTDSINELVVKLEPSSGKAIEWMSSNYVIANLLKFHVTILTKPPKDIVETTLNMEGHLIKDGEEADLLGILIDQRLSFSGQKAAEQLNSLKRPSSYLSFPQRKLWLSRLPCLISIFALLSGISAVQRIITK